ncbi:MAG: serine hydrolase [Alphaproteobacteria bacterium]|nr:serine hydrolase [Alphaproteobacteria bacterium]
MRIAIAAIAAIAIAGIIAAARLDPVVRVGAGFKAKIACSEAFVAGRPDGDILASEFAGVDDALAYIPLRIDRARQSTHAGIGPIGRAAAVYRDGYGCTLATGPLADLPRLAPVSPTALSEADPAAMGFDPAALATALDAIMGDPAPAHRAIVAEREGAIVAERYADGLSRDTPMLSWSMAKSVTATMIGIAVGDGLIDIEESPPIEEWSANNDPRQAISWRDLLHMQSGLAFREDYGDPRSDVNQMLFAQESAARAAIDQPLEHAPGNHWSYSSGTTNLLQHALRRTLEDAGVNYHAFARDRLFAPLGMASATLEPDAAGDFIGSSYMYATARDWAKLGRLYLEDGVWNGQRILPAGWAEFVATPSGASDRQYGAQFWLNFEGRDGRPADMPSLPRNAFYFAGHEGQYVVMLPDEDIVLVRLGRTRGMPAIKAADAAFGRIFDAYQGAGAASAPETDIPATENVDD